MDPPPSRSFPHFTDSRALTIVWAMALLMLAGYALRVAIGRTTHGFIAYYAASRLFMTGDLGPWVYEDSWFIRYVQDITGSRVLEIFGPNAPTMALLALPVALLGPSGARGLWLAASLVGVALASAALVRHGIRRDERVPPVFVALMLLGPVVFANLRTGQAYLLVFATLTAAALCLVRDQDVRAGVLIGLALMLKSSGLPLLLLLIARRRARPVAAAVLVYVAGAALLMPWVGLGTWMRYRAYVWHFVQRPSASVTAYQTTRGLFRHLFIGGPDWSRAADCAAVATVVPGVLIAIAVVITVCVTFRARTELWIAAGVCLSVLAMPIAEEHHFALLGIPMMFVLQARARAARAEGAPSWWPWLVLAVLLVVPLEYTAYRYAAGWSALAAYPRLYAAWLLWGLTIAEMLRDREPPEGHEPMGTLNEASGRGWRAIRSTFLGEGRSLVRWSHRRPRLRPIA